MLAFAKQTNPSSFFSFKSSPPSAHPKKTLQVSLSNCHKTADDQNKTGLIKRGMGFFLERFGISVKEMVEERKRH